MATNFESLRPNRSLLNPKFDGYKLSSDQLLVQSTSLPDAVKEVPLRDDIFSYLHVKAFGWTNHLVIDEWCEADEKRLLYFVDENNAVNQIVIQDGNVHTFCKVFEIPSVEEKQLHHLNAFVLFPSSIYAIISDGSGTLYVIHTGSRLQQLDWQVVCMHSVGKPFSVLHGNFDPSSKSLASLLLSVTPDEDSGSFHVKHTVLLTVIVFSCEVENEEIKFGFEVQKEFFGHSVPLYGALELNNQAILVASEKPFSLIFGKNGDCPYQSYDDVNPVVSEDGEQAKSKKDFAWSEENDSVTILFPLPEGVKKDDIIFDIKTKWMNVGLKGGATLLKGDLFADVEADSCTWTTETKRIEVTLAKSNSDEPWTEVVKGDRRGIYQPNGKDMSTFEEILNTKPIERASTLLNQGELEECDSLPEDVLYIVRMDLKDGNITQKTSLSTHQWLFTKTINPRDPPSFCIRHDVDALIWQPCTDKDNNGVTWNHIGTLDAFGFVHASKKEQKFTSCSPDMSYGVICDVRNHIFTYHRHTVEDAVHAKQKLLQLDDVGSEGIIGVQACNDMVFVLAKKKLFLVKSF